MTCNTCQDRFINQIFPLEKGCLTSTTGQHFYSGAIDSFCILLALLKTGGKPVCSAAGWRLSGLTCTGDRDVFEHIDLGFHCFLQVL